MSESRLSIKDHFVVERGREFAGYHYIIDVWGGVRLEDAAHIEKALAATADACSATVLHIHTHQFTDACGVSGVAVLAESHISVHTWPERQYAAFDVFMCGDAQPELAVPVLKQFFQPNDIGVRVLRRGELPPDTNFPVRSEELLIESP